MRALPDHGTRRRYTRGCRCVVCRAANAAYSSAHRTPTGFVPADDARRHLVQLAARGCGVRQLSRLTGLSPRILRAIRRGIQTALRPSTAARILAATPTLAPGAHVRATRSWRFLHSLRCEGYSRRTIAKSLGLRSHQLSYPPHAIRASSARRIAAVYLQLAAL